MRRASLVSNEFYQNAAKSFPSDDTVNYRREWGPVSPMMSARGGYDEGESAGVLYGILVPRVGLKKFVLYSRLVKV